MLANARVARVRLQPDHRLLVPPARRARSPASSRRSTTPTASGTATCCAPTTPGGRGPTRTSTCRRSCPSTASTACTFPCPTSDSRSRSRCGRTGQRRSPPWSAACAGPRPRARWSGMLIRRPLVTLPHFGADPPARHRAVAAPPSRHPPTAPRTAGGRPMTTYPVARRSNNHFVPRPAEGVWPGPGQPTPHSQARGPGSPRPCSDGRCARCRFASCSQAASASAAADRTSPVMRIVRPAAFFHRLGCNSKIGFGESYMVGRLDGHRAGRPADAVRGPALDAHPAADATDRATLRRSAPAAARSATRSRARGRTSTATTTCPTSCSRRSSTRR